MVQILTVYARLFKTKIIIIRMLTNLIRFQPAVAIH